MTILNRFKQQSNLLNSNAFGLLSLREYYESTRDKLTQWCGNQSFDESNQTVTWTDDTGEVRTINLSLDQYTEAINDPLRTFIFIDTVTSQSIEIVGSRLTELYPEWPTEQIDNTVDRLQLSIETASGNIIGTISSLDYHNCISGVQDAVNMVISESGDVISVSADKVIAAIENLADQAAIQSEFISYCLDNEVVKAQEFCSNLLSQFPALSQSMIEPFKALLTSGDPIQAIKGLIATVSNTSYTIHGSDQDQYIEIYNKADYTGVSVASIIWTRITSAMSTAVDTVVNVMQRTKNVFIALGQGIETVAKGLLKLIAGRFFTRYSKTTKSMGIIDIPLIQARLGLITEVDGQLRIDQRYYSDIKQVQSAILTNCTSEMSDRRYGTFTQVGNSLGMNIASIMSNALGDGYTSPTLGALVDQVISETIDGERYYRPMDTFIPTPHNPECGIILRVGVAKEGINEYLLLQVYPFIPRNWTELQANDGEIYTNIALSVFGQCLSTMADCFPVCRPWDTNNVLRTKASALSSLTIQRGDFMTSLSASETDNVDVVSHLLFFTPEDWVNSIQNLSTDSTQRKTIIRVMNIMCGGFIPYICGCVKDKISYNASYFQWNSAYYTASINSGEWIEDLDFTQAAVMAPIYNPYIQRGLSPVSIHYQTSGDMATEVMIGIGAIVLAAAAIYVGVKLAKFKKNLMYKSQIAQGYADNMSWTIGSNPTETQMKDYIKARKKSNRLNKLCSKLGVTSVIQAVDNTQSLSAAIHDHILSMQGVNLTGDDPDYTTVTMKDITDLNVEVRNLIIAVSRLIRIVD